MCPYTSCRSAACMIICVPCASPVNICGEYSPDQLPMFWDGQAYLTYRLGGAVSELLYSPATYGIDYGSSAGALPRPRARANPMMAVCGNTLCLLGGVVEVRSLRTCPLPQPASACHKALCSFVADWFCSCSKPHKCSTGTHCTIKKNSHLLCGQVCCLRANNAPGLPSICPGICSLTDSEPVRTPHCRVA